ncbi:MAG: alpha/beta fold hydrolase [Leptolyngbyaceae bacterium]|nr:alpha/beta fold hydrolase [Leptolyngbyaceae bacterium]
MPASVFLSLPIGLGATLFTLLTQATPVMAAEEILASFGIVQASIPVASLETYVEEGIIDSELSPYTRYFEMEQLAELRRLLGTPLAVDRQAMTNLLYTAPGETLLKRVGEVVRTRRNNGFFALRSALVLSAWQNEAGLTPIDVLKRFPTDSLVIDVGEGLSIARDVEQLINQSSEAIALVKTQFEATLSTPSSPPLLENSLMEPGPYPWQQATAALPLERRAFPLNIYLPDRPNLAPIVVISHGLGSNLDSYRYLAEHLASHGMAVVTLEHEGSNAAHIEALMAGIADEVAEPEEFINRTSDITAVLDALEEAATLDPALKDRLDFEHIGVVGQSFGGYTALALAGATFDFEYLAAQCTDDLPSGGEGGDRNFNLSLILQCRALALEDDPVFADQNSLRDERIDAAIAINPIGSAIFGANGFQQIRIPTMIMTGSADVVAPTLWEQLTPFSWLQTPNKYLLMMHQGTHFSTIGTTEADVPLPDVILGPTPDIAQQYVRALSLAFFQTYLGQDASLQAVSDPQTVSPQLMPLSSDYVHAISQDSMPLSLIRELDVGFLD